MTEHRPLSAWLDSYRVPLREALDRCRADGFGLIVPNTAASELDPLSMGQTARRHFSKHLQSIGLRIRSLATEFAGAGLSDTAHGERRLEHLRASLELARDLGAMRATVKIAGLADDRLHAMAGAMLAEAADLSDRTGVTISVHGTTGDLEPLLRRIVELNCPTLRLALDSAAVCAAPQLAQSAVERLGDLFLRDGRMHGELFEETPFGNGDVDFARILSAAESNEIETIGIVRRDTPGSVDALRRGREYISSLMGART